MTGDPVSEAQIDALAAALSVVGESHAELMSQQQPVEAVSGTNNVDVIALCTELETAMAAFDPGAADMVEQLLGTQEPGSEVAQRLTAAKEFLDAFNFPDAEPLLAGLKEELQA
jgi:hypothetical protein